MKQIRGFLARDPEPPQVRFPEIDKTFWREGIDRRLKPQQHRFRRLQRDLLFENYVYECCKPGGASPHRWRAVSSKYSGEYLIARGEILCRLDQGFRS